MCLRRKRRWLRYVVAFVGLVTVAFLGITWECWWLRTSGAKVSLDGTPAPTLSVFRSLRGDVLMFIPESGYQRPYFVDVHQQHVLVPNWNEAIVLSGIALSRHRGPYGVLMPNNVAAISQPQRESDVIGTADFRPTHPSGQIQLIGIIEVPSHLVIKTDHIEFTTMTTRQRVRVTW